MPAVPERVLVAFLRLARYNRVWVDPAVAAAHLAERTLRPLAYAPPRRLRGDVRLEVERVAGWPVYTLSPTTAAARGSVLYGHGGGWVNEIATQHWQLCAQIAAEAATRVLVPIYPLIPEGTAAAVDAGFVDLALDCLGSARGPLVLAGDSAGGQIVLSAAQLLRDEHDVRAARTVLIAPAVDPSLSNPQIADYEPRDPWLNRAGVRVFVERWRGDLALDDPRVSPLLGELAGLGPLTVFCGTRDIVCPDARKLVAEARAAGVSVDYHEGADLVHVYPLLPTASGALARRQIVAAIAAAVGAET